MSERRANCAVFRDPCPVTHKTDVNIDTNNSLLRRDGVCGQVRLLAGLVGVPAVDLEELDVHARLLWG